MKEKLIIAHRGDTTCAVENTIESFEGAVRKGADMIEFDVRRTRDGVFIAHHGRTIGNKLINATDWDEIEKINRQRSISVPKLEEVLKIAKGRIKLDIEIKESGNEAELMEIVLQYLDRKDFIITSFDDISIRRVKEKYPKVRTGLLLSIRKSKRKISNLLSYPRRGSNLTDFFLPHSFLVRLGFLKRVKRYRKRSIAWGVNSRRMMKKMLGDDRVEGIITDKLDIALKIRRELISKK
jgi:glycerophosphoryl diester phosphodiesterase